MATKIYGSSDDLIEFEGDVYGEVDHYGTDESTRGDLIFCSDGSLLEIKYGKADMGIWGITVLSAGALFQKIETCMDEDAKIHSDIALFNDGLKWAYVAKEWVNAK